MYPELEMFARIAEEQFLQPNELELIKKHAQSMPQRLATYESLRDREIEIFQPVADQLVQAFPAQDTEVLEQALSHWLLILRYCGMAMLSNNPDLLQQQLAFWFRGLVQLPTMHEVEHKLYQLLQSRLKEVLSAEAQQLLLPFFQQIESTLLHVQVAA